MSSSTFRPLPSVFVALVCTSWLLPAPAPVGAVIVQSAQKLDELSSAALSSEEEVELEPCLCGVFMSGQLNRTRVRTRGRRVPRPAPRGSPVLQYDTEEVLLPCGAQGYKHCVNKCLDEIVKHLPKAAPLVCSALERDCHRERAHLFIKNCEDKWVSTSFSAGKEFCCKDSEPVKCTDL